MALLDGDRVVAETQLDAHRRSATTLAPAVQEILRRTNWVPRELQAIAVDVGPGSFTGLRLGVTTAKVLAYAWQAQLVAVDAWEAMASQAEPGETDLEVVIDAQRGQLCVARFRHGLGGPTRIGDPRLMDRDEWLARLAAGVQVTGEALENLRGSFPNSARVVPPDQWQPRAATIGRIGHARLLTRPAGGLESPTALGSPEAVSDVWQVVPIYLRPSAAEEKLTSALP